MFRVKYREKDVLYHYLNGNYHREDGPAIEFDGVSHWYKNGKMHRLDGPAIEFSNDDLGGYFIDDTCYTYAEWQHRVKCLK